MIKNNFKLSNGILLRNIKKKGTTRYFVCFTVIQKKKNLLSD